MNIPQILNIAAEILRAKGIAESRREAASLLAFALGKDKTFLVAHAEYELSAEEQTRFDEVIGRRANREPFQYIVGRQEFYGLNFLVTNDVLIPRPETELIVEAAIEILKNKPSKFCEVGIGSGCISVSILNALKNTSAIGSDISQNALKVAKKNAEIHRVSGRLELKVSDVFDSLLEEKFDLIVSNPPYISVEDVKTLQPEVRDFEPPAALTDGADGFSIIEKIIVDSPRFLIEDGFLLMEIGFGQARAVEKMFDKNTWRRIEFLPDLQNIPRTIKAEKG